jgi:hypothetical protein
MKVEFRNIIDKNTAKYEATTIDLSSRNEKLEKQLTEATK